MPRKTHPKPDQLRLVWVDIREVPASCLLYDPDGTGRPICTSGGVTYVEGDFDSQPQPGHRPFFGLNGTGKPVGFDPNSQDLG